MASVTGRAGAAPEIPRAQLARAKTPFDLTLLKGRRATG